MRWGSRGEAAYLMLSTAPRWQNGGTVVRHAWIPSASWTLALRIRAPMNTEMLLVTTPTS